MREREKDERERGRKEREREGEKMREREGERRERGRKGDRMKNDYYTCCSCGKFVLAVFGQVEHAFYRVPGFLTYTHLLSTNVTWCQFHSVLKPSNNYTRELLNGCLPGKVTWNHAPVQLPATGK